MACQRSGSEADRHGDDGRLRRLAAKVDGEVAVLGLLGAFVGRHVDDEPFAEPETVTAIHHLALGDLDLFAKSSSNTLTTTPFVAVTFLSVT